MMDDVLAIIPARSGSKSVKDKNIRLINNKPMLAYSIEHALKSKLITRTIVSTDSEQYAEIARKFGAQVPFLRPLEYATDTALDYDVFLHALQFLKQKENYVPKLVVQLRPTYPVRNSQDIDRMIMQMLDDATIDSMRCVTPATEIPHKMWICNASEEQNAAQIVPIMRDIPEGYNMPRQQLPKVYYQNACIDVIRTSVILEQHSMSGKKIFGYQMKENFDIDTEEEFKRAEEYLRIANGNKRFVFDIDGVIANFSVTLDYTNASPNEVMIDTVNKLFDLGNQIVLFTARGYTTGTDWEQITKEQMNRWGVKYHELIFGKPNADYYVDDKMLDMNFLLRYFG